jgi:hypothetical protein
MAQDPELPNPSHALDLVAVFQSTNTDAEWESNNVASVLEASGIPAVISGTPAMPPLGFEVLVPRGRLKEAQMLLEEAEAAGPAAAEEAEAESER